MTDIVVIRFLGDREGDDVIDTLLSTIPVALSRGRAELDDQATAQVEREVVVPYTVGLDLGETVQVSDSLQGQTYVGKIVGLDYLNEVAKATVNVKLKVPSSFFS